MHEVSYYHGPHIWCQIVLGFTLVSHFHSWKPHLCIGPMELKTLTPWLLLEMIIYLVLLMYRFSTVTLLTRKEGSVARKEDFYKKEDSVITRIINTCINSLLAECSLPSLQTMSDNIKHNCANTKESKHYMELEITSS